MDTLALLCPLQYGGSGQGCQPPNLITTLINIALKPGTHQTSLLLSSCASSPCYTVAGRTLLVPNNCVYYTSYSVTGAVDEPMYAGQGSVQTILLLVAFICVPWLLLVKPLYLRHANSKKAVIPHGDAGTILCSASRGRNHLPSTSSYPLLHFSSTPLHQSHLSLHPTPQLNMSGSHNPLLKDMEDNSHANPHGAADHSGAGGGDHGHGGEFNFGEIFIHQVMALQRRHTDQQHH